MGKLTAQLAALCIALWGQHLIRSGMPGEAYRVRDAVLLFGVAALIFAWTRTEAAVRARPASAPPLHRGLLLGFLPAAGGLALASSLIFARGGNPLAGAGLWMLSLAVVSAAWFAAVRWEGRAPDRASATAELRIWGVGLSAILALALLAHFWIWSGMPQSCSGVTCDWSAAVRAFWASAGRPPAMADGGLGVAILAGLWPVAPEETLSLLRGISLTAGVLTVWGLFAVGRRMANPEAGLLTAALLALTPHFARFNLSPNPLSLLPLWGVLFVGSWALLVRRPSHSGLLLSGLLFGLLWQEAPPLRLALLIWLGVGAGVGVWRGRRGASRRWTESVTALGDRLLHFGLPALVGAAPGLGLGWATGTLLGGGPAPAAWSTAAVEFWNGLVHPVGLAGGLGEGGVALLGPLAVALAVIGLGALVVDEEGDFLAWGVLLLCGALLMHSTPAASVWPLFGGLAPLILAAAAAGTGQLWLSVSRVWRPLVRPAWLFAAAGGLVVGMGLWQTMDAVRSVGGPEVGQAQAPAAGTDGAQSLDPLLDVTRLSLPVLPVQQIWQVGVACGSREGQFAQPRGVAIDGASGRVYVTDTGNRRLVALDLLSGTPLNVYDDPRLEEPVDLALDRSGAILILDARSPTPIYRLEPVTGRLDGVTPSGGFYRPRGFSVDRQGALYVADTGGNRLVALGQDGTLYSDFGGDRGVLAGLQPVDSLVNWRNEVWAIVAQEGLLFRMGSGSAMIVTVPANTLDGPHLAQLPDGAFFVSDPEGRQVLHLAQDGRPVGRWGDGAVLAKPVGIGAAQIEETAYIAVADSEACRITMWSVDRDRLAPLE